MKSNIFLIMLFLTVAAGSRINSGVLELKVLDKHGKKLPCRILIRPQDKECIIPEEAVTLRIGPDIWFYSDGINKLQVPDGKVLLRVEHGLEFCRFKEVIEVTGQITNKTVTLKRWINMKQMSYLCAENHLHVDAVSLGPMLIGEGLDFGTSLTWWNGPDSLRPVPPGKGRTRILTFGNKQVETSIHDAELEYGWGAAYIQYLPSPIPFPSNRDRPNLDYIKNAVQSGGIVHYQGGWSRELTLDALLGYVHTVNVCNNNFHMHRFQLRSIYSNLLDVEGFPTYPDTELGMMYMNTDTYYRLLNWGLHLAAGAGSATGAKEVPVGYNRTYVLVDTNTTLNEFNRKWTAGKNFVTNGPVLFLQTEKGHRPGDIINLPAKGGRVSLELETISDQDLFSVEVIVNGKVVKRLKIIDTHLVKGRADIDIQEGSWIAARCTANDNLLTDEELAVYSYGEDAHPRRIRPSRLRYAHTSPIYVYVGGKGTAVKESIDEGFLMLERFEVYAKNHTDSKYLESILDAVQQARGVLEKCLNDE